MRDARLDNDFIWNREGVVHETHKNMKPGTGEEGH